MCKPIWFDVRAKELEALDAVGDVLGWLGRGADVGHQADGETSSVPVGRWSYASVAMELGGWLRALDGCSKGELRWHEGSPQPQPPRTHRLFSHLPWRLEGVREEVLGEDEDGEVEQDGDGNEDVRLSHGMQGMEEGKSWLEEDDIEDVD